MFFLEGGVVLVHFDPHWSLLRTDLAPFGVVGVLMVDIKAEKKATREAEAKAGWADYLAEQKAVDKNTERLRALRLAKEAEEAARPKPAEAAPPPKRRKAKPSS
jgi:hypothetical protein